MPAFVQHRLPVTLTYHQPLSAAVYVMLYSVHYFVVKTKMTGFFQTAFYFGYTAMFCLGKRLLDQAAAARVG